MPCNHIRVVAPGAAVNRRNVEQAASLLEAQGCHVTFGAHVFDRYRYLAGATADRLRDLRDAFLDDAADVVWCARGGAGAVQLLPHLGEWFARKPIVGYSDSCCLLAEAQRRGGQAVHGPVFEELVLGPDDRLLRPDAIDALRLLDQLGGATPSPRTCPVEAVQGVGPRDAITGCAVGGNLTTLCCMQGTPWAPSFDRGILLLEDVGEPYYRIERMLVQLLQAGALDGVRAVVLGEFFNCPRKDVAHSIEQIVAEHLSPLGLPLFTGAPIGHGERNMPWRVGAAATLENNVLTLEARA